jgi:16S rRNA (cytosine967-C5)-methyltransferase
LLHAQNPRQIAARVLSQRLTGGEFTENLLETALATARLSPVDRGLCHELVCGVVRWQATLDCLIARKTMPGREQRPALQNLLRLGLYQIFWLDRIPPHAAVHETVEQAKRAGYGHQAGFINAVLRGYLRETGEIKKILADMKISQPALGWSHPEWLVDKWRKHFGDEKTRQLLEWNNTPPKTFARVNTLKTDAGKLVERWREENVEYEFFTRDWTGENLAFELKAHPPLNSLPSFRDGWFYLQDPSTLLAPALLGAQPGETILDLCAAPGGKTTFIAQLMDDTGKIVAQDLAPDRLKLIRENCARLGVTCVEAALPSTINHQLSTGFVRILIDAPCSNTGVMRRRVDLRWRISPEEILRLQKAQIELLKQAAAKLKPGGVLVYSTCSLEPEENSDVVKAFLREHQDFNLETERQLLPFADGVDGAYVARLKHSA